MGCLNSKGQFNHWFGNIHLSGPCNRSCYFCIGQHMMALDPINNLRTWPLKNLHSFIYTCLHHNITEVNVTGTNTDPLLYERLAELKIELCRFIPNLVFGIRTNGVLSKQRQHILKIFDKGSLTICSFNKAIYKKMMGSGQPPNLQEIMPFYRHFTDLKLNIVLGDENMLTKDILKTIKVAQQHGIKKINLREPYGQSHIGDPLKKWGYKPSYKHLGMPVYLFENTKVCYWDVHYVEVESVNLYANGVVSETYPITKGHDPIAGKVLDQSNFKKGRHQKQWLKNKPSLNTKHD